MHLYTGPSTTPHLQLQMTHPHMHALCCRTLAQTALVSAPWHGATRLPSWAIHCQHNVVTDPLPLGTHLPCVPKVGVVRTRHKHQLCLATYTRRQAVGTYRRSILRTKLVSNHEQHSSRCCICSGTCGSLLLSGCSVPMLTPLQGYRHEHHPSA